ncbi:MAG TPA: DMT family transporter [Steroidobacteraceae bacterium]|jgi:drug/metabolite transporter (DMT)-like permease|nr:DMT family transporter [Steroidobacteraceae bacterium]
MREFDANGADKLASPAVGVLDRAGLAAALVATLAWGLTGTFIHLTTTASAGLITVFRLLVSAALLSLIGLLRPAVLRRTRAPWAPVVAMAAYYVLATEAFTRAPVVEVTLLVGAAPLITLTFDWIGGRPVTRRRAIGVVIAVVGLAAFIFPGSQYSVRSLVGDVLALGAALVSAVYVTRLRAAALAGQALDAVTIATRASLVGGIASILLLIFRQPASMPNVSSHDIGCLVMLGVFSTAVPTVAYSEASRRLPATVTTSLSLLTPLFAAVFAGIVLSEWPAIYRLPGAALAFAGICVVVLSN